MDLVALLEKMTPPPYISLALSSSGRLALFLLHPSVAAGGGVGGAGGGGLPAAALTATLGGRDRGAAGSDGGEVWWMWGVRVSGGEGVAAGGRPGEPRGDDGERDGVEGGAQLADGAQREHLDSGLAGSRGEERRATQF